MNKQQGQNQQDKSQQGGNVGQQDKGSQQSQSGRQGQHSADRDQSSSRQSDSNLNPGSQQGERDRGQDKSR